MRNIFWFIGIGILSLGCAVIAVFKNRHAFRLSTLLVFYLSVSGFTWICEFIVLGLFNAYAYKTGVVDDIWAQNLLGHLILNTTIYPSVAVVTAISKRRKFVALIIIVILSVIEIIFVKLGLYEQHWWRYYMTVITVGVILIMTVVWFEKIKHGCVGWRRAATFFFVALFIVHIPAPLLLLLGRQYYQLRILNDFFDNRVLSSIVFIFSYHVLECAVLVLITCLSKKRYLKILPFIISVVFQYLFSKFGLLVIGSNWHILYTLAIYEVCIGAYMLIEKKTLKPVTTA